MAFLLILCILSSLILLFSVGCQEVNIAHYIHARDFAKDVSIFIVGNFFTVASGD